MPHVMIIAEAGVNHNGNIKLAMEMVGKAKEAGADYIKFQTFKPEMIASRYASKADYQKKTTDAIESQQDMLKKLTLSGDEYQLLAEEAKKIGIGFVSTPFEIESFRFLQKIDMDFWKIPSGEVTNYPFLVEIAKTGKPIVMSTGMCCLEDVKAAVKLLKENGAAEISLLHCNTQYPTPYEDVNLKVMDTLRREFECPVGYSDHTQGIEVPIAAAAMGAAIIEKHFTLDRSMEGPDHRASIEPDELSIMVKAVRNIEKAIGSQDKIMTASESCNVDIVRKSIVAKKKIMKGSILSNDNITTKRPGNGLSPMLWPKVLGTRAVRDFEEDELIEI